MFDTVFICLVLIIYVRFFIVSNADKKSIDEVYDREDWREKKDRLHYLSLKKVFDLTKWKYRDFYPEGWLD